MNYQLYDKIGNGQHSVVYKGRKKHSIEYYAVKSIDKSQKERVTREIRSMHMLYPHENVLRFFTWYETGKHLWIILEYCVGGNLLDIINSDLKLPEKSIRSFGKDLVKGLQYIHSKGFLYCDLKPSNILVDQDGRLKLGGFGNSRKLDDVNSNPNPDKIGRGSPHYMAPELFQEGPYSTKSDMWSLGCVLYQMAAGRAPYHTPGRRKLTELLNTIMSEPPDTLPGASAEFRDLVARLLDKNPATRLGWNDILSHPFWNETFEAVEMPKETRLEDYIATHKLMPSRKLSNSEDKKAQERAKALRESVDVLRLSQIVKSNLESDTVEREEFQTVAEVSPDDQVRLNHADIEVDFHEPPRGSPNREAERTSPNRQIQPSSSNPENTQVEGENHNENPPASPSPESSCETNNPVDSQGSKKKVDGQPSKRGQTQGSEGAPKTSEGNSEGKTSSSGRTASSESSNHVGRTGETHLTKGGSAQPCETSGRGSPGGSSKNSSNRSDARLLAISELIWHDIDTTVRPIMTNRRIERLDMPKLDAKYLPFRAKSPFDVEHCRQEEQESVVSCLNRILYSPENPRQKMSALSYLEQLAHSTPMANLIVETDLMVTLLKNLKELRGMAANMMRIKLFTVLGILIRRSTFMPEHLAKHPFVEVLTEGVKDRHPKVRARAMGSLGELLFYIASQHQPNVEDPWKVPEETARVIIDMLEFNGDIVTLHYALKTVENVASKPQSGWIVQCANEHVIGKLNAIFVDERIEQNVKTTAACAMGRLLRINQSLVPLYLEKYGIELITKRLGDISNSRLQTVAVNVLNMALLHKDLNKTILNQLVDEQNLALPLVSFLSQSTQVLWCKGLAAIFLLSRHSVKFFVQVCQTKFLILLEKMTRNKTDVFQKIARLAKREVGRRVSQLVAQVCWDLNVCKQDASNTKDLKLTLAKMEVLQSLVLSSFWRERVISKDLISNLAVLLEGVLAPTNAFPNLQEFSNSVLSTVESVCRPTQFLIKHWEVVVGQLLPVLSGAMKRSEKNSEVRFHSLRLIHDVLQCYIPDNGLYAPHTSLEERDRKRTGKAKDKIDSFVRENVLPLIPSFLNDVDLIPLFAIKVLCCLVENNTDYMRDIESLDLLDSVFRILSYENNCSSVHSVKLCRYIVEYSSLPAETLNKMNAAEKVVTFLEDTYANNVEQFFEPVLELCLALARREARDLMLNKYRRADPHHISENFRSSSDEQQNCVQLMSTLNTLMDLMSHPDGAVSLGAAQCVEFLARTFPKAACEMEFFSESNIEPLVEVLTPKPNLQKHTSTQKQALVALSFVSDPNVRLTVDSSLSNQENQEVGTTPSWFLNLIEVVAYWKNAMDQEVSQLARNVESMLLKNSPE
ncbi:hypothetical protein BSKO_13601 [Bryopsis sp. KO-2023]|nr:hypothetical protein BSKO_13601 [Bryopsis sp. KO-2023]